MTDAALATAEATLRAAAARLSEAGLEDAFTDARLLLEAAAGLDRASLLRNPDRVLSAAEAERLEGFLARRCAGEPVSRIVGRRGFWSLDLAVTPDVLDPRADTETLVEAALVALAGRLGEPLRVLDLGVGSGALLCAALTELPSATGIGVDVSPAAAAIAAQNAAACGLAERCEVRVGRWFEPVSGRFDLILSNPPYIATAEIVGLATEVRAHDPHLALDGGADGLDAYRELAPSLAAHLAAEGVAVLEVGLGQDRDVTHLMEDAGLRLLQVRRDLAGHARAIVLGPEA